MIDANIQIIELAGRRFVVIPEEDFQTLRRLADKPDLSIPAESNQKPRFSAFTPLKVPGVPASEMLLQDRR